MSGRVALGQEITRHARRHAEARQRTHRGVVTALKPLTVELFGSDTVLAADDDFDLSQWAAFYDHVVKIEIDDVVLLHEQDEWVLFDVVTDKDVAAAFGDWRDGS